jgi:hypothetical protein
MISEHKINTKQNDRHTDNAAQMVSYLSRAMAALKALRMSADFLRFRVRFQFILLD